MNRAPLVALAFLFAGGAPALADDYAAISGTAMAITGDVSFDDFSLVFENGETLVFEDLVADSFEVGGETVGASVFSLAEAADPVLLNGNTLCGGEAVTYVGSWSGSMEGTTIIAFFSTQDEPSSDAEMCASYTYE
ncbi:hypothetical protein [Aurantimonas sp. HBX-1]|uniref:hypothetical protein n=1 Tax=Aurantimonas sp. HBX-1 TaxID=2906072 RepID=UPI001F486FD6|nr:hypothetical protein [Aurantimonas sp. HBX-1]UIJ72660.1 hypothetical protein LXB15_03095 [Aurantimonas sp. HBX-1]